MKAYKLEIRVTTICLILVCLTGGFLSSFFVILNESFFSKVATPAHLVQYYGESMFVVQKYVMGFPLHYFLLIVFSWIGVSLIGAIWCLVMDKLEDQQRT
ncbi:MAG: hypothetical protein AB1767_12790 [Bacillota bacterium]